MKKILIDVFGSDHPEQLLEGCARCTLEVPDVMLVLPGEETMLRAELEKYPCNWDALEFMPASDPIGYCQKNDSHHQLHTRFYGRKCTLFFFLFTG